MFCVLLMRYAMLLSVSTHFINFYQTLQCRIMMKFRFTDKHLGLQESAQINLYLQSCGQSNTILRHHSTNT